MWWVGASAEGRNPPMREEPKEPSFFSEGLSLASLSRVAVAVEKLDVRRFDIGSPEASEAALNFRRRNPEGRSSSSPFPFPFILLLLLVLLILTGSSSESAGTGSVGPIAAFFFDFLAQTSNNYLLSLSSSGSASVS